MSDEFRFECYPGAQRTARIEADFVVFCDLGVGATIYVLRVRNGLLYFSTHPQERVSPVWTTLLPLPPEIQDDGAELVSWWREQVSIGRFGLFDKSYVWGCLGQGRYRAWWDASGGEPFRWPNCATAQPSALLREPQRGRDLANLPSLWSNRARLLYDRAWFHPLMCAQERAQWRQIPPLRNGGELITRALNRPIPPRLSAAEPLSWRRDSMDKLASLARAIVRNVPSVWQHFDQLNLFVAAHTLVDYGTFMVMPSMNPDENDAYGWYESNGEALLSLLFHDFVPRGWHWTRRTERHHCQPEQFQFGVTAPSRHERIEARLSIRDWLNDLTENNRLRAADAKFLLEWPTGHTEDWWIIESERILAAFEP